MARLLIFPAVTVAAINGHAFGAGAQLTLTHDYRVMRTERSYWCMPEIDLGAPLHPGMTALIKARLPHQTAHELIVTGNRYSAQSAEKKESSIMPSRRRMFFRRQSKLPKAWRAKPIRSCSSSRQEYIHRPWKPSAIAPNNAPEHGRKEGRRASR